MKSAEMIRVTSVGTLTHFGDMVHDVTEARSAQLLQAIEDVISGLSMDRDFACLFAKEAEKFTQHIASGGPPNPIDPDGRAEAVLLRAQNASAELRNRLIRGCNSAKADPALREEDGVVAEFEATIAAFGYLHDTLNALRWQVMEHDADLSPTAGAADNADDLFAALDR